MTAHPPFHITINRRPFEAPAAQMTGLNILALAGYGADYELLQLHGEGDPTGGKPIGHADDVDMRNGLHFRAIPGNANFGFRGTDNTDLDEDVARVEEHYAVEVFVEGVVVGVVLKDVPLPPGYNTESSDVLVQTTLQYPASAMDMFWVDRDVLLAGDTIPQSAECLEVHFGRTWRRFSWHRNSDWVPGRDDLASHIEMCLARLEQAR